MKNKENERIESFIKLVRGSDPVENFNVLDLGELVHMGFYKDEEEAKWASSSEIITEIFTKGSCGRFALILKFVFPEGEIYELENKCHIVFKLNDKLYDVTGDVTEKYKDSELLETNNKSLEDFIDNYSFADRGPIL